eukprot:GHVQ01042974.1.p1 GENE.GHVQ01042974.1~~GHVQ01042974.1.p1  ORF type:complete len:338 (+),score=44.11 GHVQ01042974.1:57-1070(+)
MTPVLYPLSYTLRPHHSLSSPPVPHLPCLRHIYPHIPWGGCLLLCVLSLSLTNTNYKLYVINELSTNMSIDSVKLLVSRAWVDHTARVQSMSKALGYELSYVQAQLAIILIALIAIYCIATAVRRIGAYSYGGATKGRSDCVLLLGQCGAGKTALFLRLANLYNSETVSSIKANRGSFPLGEDNKSTLTEVIDYPGHRRLREGALSLLPSAKCIVYLVDAADKGSIKNAAEHLYELFTSPPMTHLHLPILIACNKTDLPKARSPFTIKIDIEREIERLKVSRSATLEGQDAADSYIGELDELFQMDMVPSVTEFCASSTLQGDIEGIVEFITRPHLS